MALQAGRFLFARRLRKKRRMAGAAGVFGYDAIAFCNDNIFRISAGGESQAVIEAIDGLGGVLTHHVMRGMAIVAGGAGTMAAL